MDNVKFYEFDTSKAPRNWDKRKAIFAWEGDDLYITARVANMDETLAFLFCTQDGHKVFRHGGVLLIPEKWLRRERPQMSKDLDQLRKNCLEVRMKFENANG